MSQLSDYFQPYRAIITIKDKTNDPTYLIYDSFHPPDPTTQSPFISYATVDLVYGQAGTFMIRIHDPDEKLDVSKIGLGNRVWIQAGRTEDNLFNLFSGVCRTFKPVRAGYNLLSYEMEGFGMQIIFNERIVNYLRQALRRPDNPQRPFFDDPNMKCYLLFKELCEKTDLIPTGRPAIKHTLYPGMFNTTDLIDPQVDTFIASITEPYVSAAQVANSLADMAGAIWGVDPSAPGTADKVFLRFPSTKHSGILIKDKPEDPTEPTTKNISYLSAKQGFSFTDSMKQEDGFTSKPFSKTGADVTSGSSAQGDANHTGLVMIDIAQQFTVNSTRLRDLAFTIHVEGMGEPFGASDTIWNPGRVNFKVVNDAGGRPGATTEVTDSFDTPTSLAGGLTQTIFLQLPQTHQLQTLRPGDKAWVIFHNDCAITWPGDGSAPCGAGHASNAVFWHHDGGSTGVSAIRTVCQRAPSQGGGRDPPFTDTASGWVVNNAGPTYSHVFFDSFSHIVESGDQDSMERYGESDTFIDAPWITDEETMSQFLASWMQYAAKPRRIYDMSHIYIPYKSPLLPGQLVTVVDTKSGLTANKHTLAEVQEVRYEFSAESTGTNPLGTNTCEVKLLGYVDYREQYILAHQEAVLTLPNPPPGTNPPLPPVITTDYIQYYGGPFMNVTNPAVHLIFWGSDWNSGTPATVRTRMIADIQAIINSEYFTGLSQYGGTKTPVYGGSVTHTTTSTSIIASDGYTTENLRTVANAAMTAGQVPNADSFVGPTVGNLAGLDVSHIYVVFVPPNHKMRPISGDPIFVGAGVQTMRRTGTGTDAAYALIGITYNPTLFPTRTFETQMRSMDATFTHEAVPSLTSPRAVLTPIQNESAYNFKMSGLPSGFFAGDTLVKDNHISADLRGTTIRVAAYWSDRDGKEIAPGCDFAEPTQPPPPQGNFIDTDKVLVLNRLDNSAGKFHRNLVDMNISGNLSSSPALSVDTDGAGTRTTLGSLVYYAFNSREGSFASGGQNRTTRLDWRSTSGGTTCGVSRAKTAGTIGRANDTKNCEVTCIFRARNFISGSSSHFHASIKPRGNGHGGSSECCLQAGGRYPFTQRGRHNELYSVEYTHPSYDYHGVSFVSPMTQSNMPLIGNNQWFGMKFIIYNTNNNQAVHTEMWVDDNPIAAGNTGFNNNWRKVWVFEHTGSRSPTWAGPNCQFRTNMASQVDVIAYNIHEIIPPTTTSSTASAIELAERAEYEESTGLQYPDYIAELIPRSQLTEEGVNSQPDLDKEIIQDNVNAIGEMVPVTDEIVGDVVPIHQPREPKPLSIETDEGDVDDIQEYGSTDIS